MSPQELLYIICGIVIAGFVFEQWLEYLNLRHMRGTIPAALKGIYPEEEYHRSLGYQRERQQFSFLLSTLGFAVLVCLLLFGGFGWLHAWLRQFSEHLVWLALAFFGVLFLVSDLLSLPFQWYSTFVIEEKWGFNKTTPKTFFADKLKGYALTLVLGGGILATAAGANYLPG